MAQRLQTCWQEVYELLLVFVLSAQVIIRWGWTNAHDVEYQPPCLFTVAQSCGPGSSESYHSLSSFKLSQALKHRDILESRERLLSPLCGLG